jgi:excisionase family DNA binding protein
MNTATYLTRQEAAARARVTDRTVDRWIRTGRLTRHRSATGRVWVDPAELARILEPRKENA